MNDNLKKKQGHTTTVCFSVHTEDDADIVKWISQQENKSEAIRRAIRTTITYSDATKYDAVNNQEERS